MAKDTAAKVPENLSALSSLAQAQLARGDRRGARQTLGDMTRFANYDADAQLAIARLQIAAGNESGAVYSLEKALGSRPDWLPALTLHTEILIGQGDYARAEQRIKQIGDSFPNSATATRLRGDLALQRQQYAASLASYQAALKKEDNGAMALRIFQAHLRAGEMGKGLAFLEHWQKSHPVDFQVLRTIGDGYLRAGNYPAARRTYEHLLQLHPNDASVLNNLAQTTQKQNDKSALTYAERATALRPGDPLFIDTLGWIHVQQGQLDRGLGLLRDARLRSPDNPEIRYHLAVALNKTGRNAEAREELGAALRSGADFDGIEDARRLQSTLGK